VKAAHWLVSIRGRLLIGFGSLLLLVMAAAAVGGGAMSRLAGAVRGELRGVEQDARLSTRLATDVAREIAVAARYVEGADARATAAFDTLRWKTHDTQRLLRRRDGQTPDEIALVVGIDQQMSDAEVRYVVARRLAELGRAEEARVQTDSARAIESEMLSSLGRLSEVKGRRVAAAAARLQTDANGGSLLLMVLLVSACLFALWVARRVLRSVTGPLDALTSHAGRLGEGDLTARTSGSFPGELGILAGAMNRTGETLSRIGAGAVDAADGIGASASSLAETATELERAVGEVTRSIEEVSGGAADQVSQLQRVDGALRAMLTRAESVADEVREVSGLAAAIEAEARTRRTETVQTIQSLLEIKQAVEFAAAETRELHAAVKDVTHFVSMVDTIAEQTNLLGLNAAIEASRAGAEGRGFAVVADEVRKLAGEAREQAERVAAITRVITERVESTTRAMAVGATRVEEIERVAHEVEGALSTIVHQAERMRAAAHEVAQMAGESTTETLGAVRGIAAVAETAVAHAEAAEGVRAATLQQEVACRSVTSAIERLTDNAQGLRELVGGLKVVRDEPEPPHEPAGNSLRKRRPRERALFG
jgi:methyl-accepting chemotaxis protein